MIGFGRLSYSGTPLEDIDKRAARRAARRLAADFVAAS